MSLHPVFILSVRVFIVKLCLSKCRYAECRYAGVGIVNVVIVYGVLNAVILRFKCVSFIVKPNCKKNDIAEFSFPFAKSLCITFIKYHYDFHYAEFCYADCRRECLGAILVPCSRFVNKFFWLSGSQAKAQNKESLKRLYSIHRLL